MIKRFSKNTLYALIISFIVAAIFSLSVTIFVNGYISDYEMESEKIMIKSTETRVFDKDGNKIAEFQKDNKKPTEYERIPVEIVEGVVSTEDQEFFEHSGVNPEAILRALVADIKAGSFVQGGSTVTQQLVKWIYLDPGKTIERKIDEAVYAVLLEEQMPKKDIMAYYLNHIFYGNRAYGVENAIRTYYGQTIEEFNQDDEATRAAKSALLVGIVNAPSAYDPYNYTEKATQRRNIVLTKMYTEGYIGKDTYETARNMGLSVLEKPITVSEDEKIHYPEFVSYTLEEARKAMGYDTIEEVMYSGMQLYTSFDPEVYKIIRKHMSRPELYPTNASDGTQVQGSTVLINPQNGEIYAMSGAREETTDFLVFNRAFQSKRQPGSSFKPIMAYGPALESGKYSPTSSLVCQSTFGSYKINASCSGSESMTEAVRGSHNGPAVWVMNKVGVKYARNFAEKLGIELDDQDIYLPIALGGLTYGVTPLELADAYQAFANGGAKADAHTLRRITNPLNEVIYTPEEPKQVIKEKTAIDMTRMLENAVNKGTGRNARIPGENIAGKTGTNQMPGSEGNKDIWFAGYNDRIVGVTWMGFDQTSASHYIRTGQTSYLTAKMFSSIVSESLKIIPKSEVKEIEPLNNLDFSVKQNIEGDKVILEWVSKPGISYEIFRNGVNVGKTTKDNFTESLSKEGTYTYKMIGYDVQSGEKKYESADVVFELIYKEPEKEEEPEEEVKEETQDEAKPEENKPEEPKAETPATPPTETKPVEEKPKQDPPKAETPAKAPVPPKETEGQSTETDTED